MFDVLWWKKKLFHYNLLFILSGIIFLLMLWVIMWINQNFVNVFFFIPDIVIYVVFINIMYFLMPYIIPVIQKKIGTNYSTKKIYRFYIILTILSNFLLLILVVVEFKLYNRSHLHWP